MFWEKDEEHQPMPFTSCVLNRFSDALTDLGASDGGPVGRHFVLDPIDGTRGFVAMRQYAVCLAMLEDGKVGAAGMLICNPQP